MASPDLHTGDVINDLMALVQERIGCQGIFDSTATHADGAPLYEEPCGKLARAFCHGCEEVFCLRCAEHHRRLRHTVTFFEKGAVS